MADPAYRSLLVVLLDLAAFHRGLVLMRGRDYWRIEDASSHARREAASGHPKTREFLNDPRFFWTIGPDKKVVVMEKKGDEEVPFAAEPGSIVQVPA